MKIVYISWFSSGEGSQVHAKEFIHGMESLGHTIIPVELSLRSPSSQKVKQEETVKRSTYQENKLKGFIRECKSLALNIPRLFRLHKLIKQHQPDCIINRYAIYDISALLAKFLFNVPYIAEVNGSVIFERNLLGKFYFKPIANYMERLIFRKADTVTLVSQELLKYFEKNHYDTTNTIVTPNGVDIEKFNPDTSIEPFGKDIKEIVRWKDKIVIGFLGSLKPWHGVERLINILPEMLNANPNIRLLIIGDGKERTRIESKLKEYNLEDHVYITGFLGHEDIPKALNMVDVCTAPYNDIDHFHFSPLKIFEYMAMGKPVVAPALGQCKELIIDDFNGILLDQNTNENLKQALLKIIEDEEYRVTLGHNAREYIAQNYTWKVNAQKIENAVYRVTNHNIKQQEA
jgi:glycosyltransferase involved in cell wall biosynthesis